MKDAQVQSQGMVRHSYKYDNLLPHRKCEQCNREFAVRNEGRTHDEKTIDQGNWSYKHLTARGAEAGDEGFVVENNLLPG